MIENIEEYKNKEDALKEIENRLELISRSKEEINLAEVHKLRIDARDIASDMREFIKREFAN